MVTHRHETTQDGPNRPDEVQLRARRSPRMVAAGVLAVVLGGLGAAALYSGATNHESAVAMARDVSRGQQISPADLRVVSVPAGLELEVMEAAAMDELVGQRALTDLPAGAFPAPRHLGEPLVPQGHSLVGLKLAAGRLPTAPLPQGTAVEIVALETGTATRAEVVGAPVPSDDGNGLLVDVAVPISAAREVATLAAKDQVALISAGQK